MKRPFVFFPAIDYQSLYQRPQHLASGLVRRGHDVYFRNVGQVGGRAPLVIEGVNVYQDWDARPAGIDDNSIYILNYPSFSGYRNWDKDEFMIYDCVDDFPDFELYQENCCNAADLISYTTDGIKDNLHMLIQDFNKDYIKIPNGVNIDFNKNRDTAPELLSLRSKYSHILGFVGAMHYSWVDVYMLQNIARMNPDWAVVIVGHTYCWDFKLSGAPSNIIHLGTKEYKDLASYYNGFDVGLITFLDNKISHGSDPIKLYEYASYGIPVVTKDLSYCSNLNEPICYKYDSLDQCINQINNAIISNFHTSNTAARMKFAEENTWEKRVDTLLDKLSELTYLEV